MLAIAVFAMVDLQVMLRSPYDLSTELAAYNFYILCITATMLLFGVSAAVVAYVSFQKSPLGKTVATSIMASTVILLISGLEDIIFFVMAGGFPANDVNWNWMLQTNIFGGWNTSSHLLWAVFWLGLVLPGALYFFFKKIGRYKVKITTTKKRHQTISFLTFMDSVEQDIMEYVAHRFPFNTLDFYSRLLVKKERKMTEYELAEGIKRLEQRGLIYEPRAGYFEGTAHRDRAIVDRGKGKMRQIIPLKLKPPIRKSKVKLIKRRSIEGWECRACGKWVKRPWEKRRLRVCPKCGRKAYYGKPIFKKAERFTEHSTKFMKVLSSQRVPGRLGGPIIRSRIHKPKTTATRMFAVPSHQLQDGTWVPSPEYPRAEAVTLKPVRKPRRMKRDEFRGSQKAKDAGAQAWDTRRAQGWMGKAQIRIAGFRKNKRTGKTHPIMVRVGRRTMKIIPRRNGLGVHPKKLTKKLTVAQLAGYKAAETRRKNLKNKKRMRNHA